MDHETLKYLTDEQKASYSPLERLFQSDGWTAVVLWAKQQQERALSAQVHATNWDRFNIAKGAAQAFSLVENLQDNTESEFMALAETNKSALVAADEDEFE